MRRGEIYIADLEPVVGSEANKNRPIVIVSNNASNQSVEKYNIGMLTIIPLTTNISNIFPFQVLLPAKITNLNYDSKAQAEQIRTISSQRLKSSLIATLPNIIMLKIDDALRLHLAI